jgi:hypothetical protein
VSGYAVKEVFGPTIQGEGLHAGMPCLFVRLAGCNAWDGRPETRAASACPYCDTDFRGGDRLDLPALLGRLADLSGDRRLGVVLTGGEPLLQADAPLLAALAARAAWVDIETNGTRPCPERPGNVFVSCSPKAVRGQPVVVEPDWWKILVPDQLGFLERALATGLPGCRPRRAGLPGQPRRLPAPVLRARLPPQPAAPQVRRRALSGGLGGVPAQA